MPGHIGGGQIPDAEELRGDEVLDHVLGAVDVLGGVAGLGHRHALAPALAGVGVGSDQQDVAGRLGPEARPERPHQRHRDADQLQTEQIHGRAAQASVAR